MKVVITSATEKEILQLKSTLPLSYLDEKADVTISFHQSGVGILSSSFAIAKLVLLQKPDVVIQAGIAGSFDNNIALGKVVVVRDETLADTGVEENGSFKDLFDLQLQDANQFPFQNRTLFNPHLEELNFQDLPEVPAITINEITTNPNRIQQLKLKYQPTIESMEGASLHYCCLQTGTRFIQLRAVSNHVGERDKSKWNFKDSIGNLTTTLVEYINQLKSLTAL